MVILQGLEKKRGQKQTWYREICECGDCKFLRNRKREYITLRVGCHGSREYFMGCS